MYLKYSFLTSIKHVFTFIFIFFLTILNVKAQKCSFDEKHQQLLKSDEVFAERILAQNEEWASIKDQFAPNNLLSGNDTVAVVVHIYHLGEAVGTGTNISDAQIQSAIDNMNDAYGATGPYSGSTDVGLRFALARYDTDCNPFSGIVRINASGYTAGGDNYGAVGMTDNNDAGMKSVSKYPNDAYYNIWVVSEIDNNGGGSGTQGYAYFAGASASVDGTVILYNSFGYDPDSSLGYNLKNYTNRNVTTIHELGHAFNVYHTFQGDASGTTCPGNTTCGTDSDCCDDTDPHIRSSSNCPSSSTANACTGGTIGDLPKNFMDYSSDACQVMFTPDQGARIAAAMAGGRASLKNSIGLTGLPTAFASPSAASCQTTTSSTGLNGGYGGLMEIKIGTKSATSSPTKYDEMTYGGSGYLDFTGDCEKTFILEEDATYTYELETFYNNHNVKAWIDYDNDNTYEASELLFNANIVGEYNSGTNKASGTFTIPASAVTDTYLKLRVLCDLSTVSDACDNPTYGQSENYPIYIKSAAEACPTTLAVSTVTNNETYKAVNTLTSNATIPASNTVTFTAGQSITLGEGFTATATSNFTASIAACNSLQAPPEESVARNSTKDILNPTNIVMTIRPNPARDFMTIDYQLNEATAAEIGLFDITGKQLSRISPIQSQNKGSYQQQVSLNELNAGMYFIILQTEKERISKKLIVVR